jgi:hypothetical protein
MTKRSGQRDIVEITKLPPGVALGTGAPVPMVQSKRKPRHWISQLWQAVIITTTINQENSQSLESPTPTESLARLLTT